ncbi:RyR domain-containing protein [Methanosarcina barkeri]|uniref:RyR domain-containing protein n=1 Tax=Methanosarcina barkeri TaxID=2208 RepID=UPI001FB3E96D|nr:RyR domain-containing protein [Methanosarcina barkeri]
MTEKERYQSMLLLRDLPDPKETSFLKKENSIVESVAAAMDTSMCENKVSPRKGKITKLDKDASFEELKDAAEDIPNKLWAINNGIRKITGKTPHIPDITGDEIETFARLEYGRLCRNKRLRQLSDSSEGKTFNNSMLQSKNYDQLEEKEKDRFRELVYTIPPILKKAGYEIYRMKNVEEISDPEIINRLARDLHEKYVQERQLKGENRETNPSLVKFEDLPEDIKEANFDNIKKIPEKLSWIHYSTRRIQQDEEQRELTLTEKEIETMAKREHDRWVWQKIMQGWTYKEGKKDFVNKTSPFIVPWNKLPPDTRINDFNAVRLIPKLLKEAGYKAYKSDSEKSD